MNENLRHFNYQITDDPDFIFRMYDVPKKVQRMLPSLHKRVLKGGQLIVEALETLILRYPQIPHLLNYLSAAHQENGDLEEAYAVNQKILEKFPGYFFGKINLAAEHLQKEEYDKVKKILGPSMELKELFPDRKIFHISEFTTFFKLAILYYCKTDNLPAAEARYNLMEEIAGDHHHVEEVRLFIADERMKAAHKKWQKEKETRISVLPDKPPVRDSDGQRPTFTHEQINRLYEEDFRIDHNILREILSLPRESLISDLETVLEDSIKRFGHFLNICDTKGWDDATMSFPLHAIFLLGELRASGSLPKVLEVLSQGDEFTEMWFGDALADVVWEPLYYLSESREDVINQFLLSPGLDPHMRSVLSSSISQVAMHQPGRKKEISLWFRKLFTTLANTGPDENIVDSTFISLAICDAIELRDPDLIPSIEALYRKGYVSEGICGSLLNVAKDIHDPQEDYHKRELLSIYDRYTRILNTWACYKEEDRTKEMQTAENSGSTAHNETGTGTHTTHLKVGRNDPCPCGSGKKFKKCCLER